MIYSDTVKQALQKTASEERANISRRFFKTDKGAYGEGDQFIGVTVPQIRKVVKQHRNLPLSECLTLLHSPFHEHRLAALLILVDQFKKGDQQVKSDIYLLYITNTTWINNWDLVDLSAEHIVGAYIDGKDTSVLYAFASSHNLWKKRISILSTFYFIKKKQYALTFSLAELLLHDDHDLIQKAVGWMLREVGKRCGEEIEESFLEKHYTTMPRTMLRYAIERFPESKKTYYMKKK